MRTPPAPPAPPRPCSPSSPTVGRLSMPDALAERRREQQRLLDRAREDVERLSARIEVEAAVVVGSVARGDFNVWSDVDVIVVAEALPARTPDRLALLLQDAPPRVQPIGFSQSELEEAKRGGNRLGPRGVGRGAAGAAAAPPQVAVPAARAREEGPEVREPHTGEVAGSARGLGEDGAIARAQADDLDLVELVQVRERAGGKEDRIPDGEPEEPHEQPAARLPLPGGRELADGPPHRPVAAAEDGILLEGLAPRLRGRG